MVKIAAVGYVRLCCRNAALVGVKHAILRPGRILRYDVEACRSYPQ